MTSPHPAAMPDLKPCGPPSYSSLYRAAAVFLWLIPAFRAALPVDAAFAFSLGGCLWWVAQRQTSPEAALLAAGFFAMLPPAHPAAPLGIFAMLYTATGVVHALQGPRRKWPPRIALMAGATLFTAAVNPAACAAALLLGFMISLWLAESRRGALFLCFAFWTAASAALSFALSRHFSSSALRPQLFRVSYLAADLERAAPFAIALGFSFAFYAARRRSRFYGHTAPLVSAVLLAAFSFAWALPFALLFLSGLAADMLRSSRGRLWRDSLSGPS